MSAAETDWVEIAALYAVLEKVHPSAGVRASRAFAVSRAKGAAEGLALLDDDSLGDYPCVHLVRGTLLEELGRDRAAIDALERAAAEARNTHEARQIQRRHRAHPGARWSMSYDSLLELIAGLALFVRLRAELRSRARRGAPA